MRLLGAPASSLGDAGDAAGGGGRVDAGREGRGRRGYKLGEQDWVGDPGRGSAVGKRERGVAEVGRRMVPRLSTTFNEPPRRLQPSPTRWEGWGRAGHRSCPLGVYSLAGETTHMHIK